MMGTRLSVNLNKVALLRNARTIGIPSVLRAAEICIEAGAHGITVHPRPDERHIRQQDVWELAAALKAAPDVELNIEGNPFPEFMELVLKVKPTQCTLVPDSPDAFTSDHGWDLKGAEAERLRSIIARLKDEVIRKSLFMETDPEQIGLARSVRADRVELYTEPYAASFARGERLEETHEALRHAAEKAQSIWLGVNAGHDLNLQNLGLFCSIPNIMEVSIGHAIVSDALEMGLANAVMAYLKVLSEAGQEEMQSSRALAS
ncbi:MAG TPA: pyridoxine 5'-phosphate synthase [Pyrinomonadaceae bacterium]|nr:pyridoxine 5'-phosphate synthase [Pyrinomonadaceae bacterium]